MKTEISSESLASPVARRCAFFARLVSLIAATTGTLVIIGWLLDIRALMSVMPGFVTMKANTALCFVLAGFALWRLALDSSDGPGKRFRWLGQLCAVLVALTGLLTIGEFVLHVNLGIDQLVIRDTLTDPHVSPGRMASATAFAFLLLGTGLFLLDTKSSVRSRVAQSFVLIAMITGVIGFLGYFYDVKALYDVTLYTTMAVHTALLFILLGLGALCARPGQGMMSVLTSEFGGGVIARQILPLAVTLPFLLGWLRLKGERAGLYGGDFGLTIFATANIIVFVTLVWLGAKSLNSIDAKRLRALEARAQAQEALREAHANLEKRVVERTVELGQANDALLVEIAERKRTEEELRKREDHLRLQTTALNAAANSVTITDIEGTIQWVNPAFTQLTGYSAEEVIGQNSRFLKSGRHSQSFYQEMWQTISRGHAWKGEMINRHKDGHLYHEELTITPVLDARGAVTHFIAIKQDISERRQAENALRESNEKFHQLADNITDVFWIRSPDLQEVQYVSPAFEQIWGRSVASLRANPQAWADFILPEDRARVLGAFAALVENGPTLDIEYRITRPDGEVRWVHVRGFQIRDATDRLVRHIGIVTDITERKRVQAELESVHQKLMEASRLGGMAEIATNVLHNVGNVLNSVNVSCNLLADNLRNSKVASLPKVVTLLREHEADLAVFLSEDPKGKHMPSYLSQLTAQLIREQTESLKELDGLQNNIDRIGEIVAMQQNYARVTGVTETLQIGELVEEALRMNARALTDREVQIIREYEEVPKIITEKQRVLEILGNLIRNAMSACDETGQPGRQVTIRVACGDHCVKISVSDNGVGIPAEKLTRIFNQEFTPREGGHGLSLHNGANAAKSMGGSLTGHSRGLGQGAAFTLQLPCPAAKSLE